jgi:hypothetical protein
MARLKTRGISSIGPPSGPPRVFGVEIEQFAKVENSTLSAGPRAKSRIFRLFKFRNGALKNAWNLVHWAAWWSSTRFRRLN